MIDIQTGNRPMDIPLIEHQDTDQATSPERADEKPERDPLRPRFVDHRNLPACYSPVDQPSHYDVRVSARTGEDLVRLSTPRDGRRT
jgi:hypothetical protein